MKILFVSAEVAPFAKVGGLADVAGSLPKALRDMGDEVRIIMPAYGLVIEDPRWKVKSLGSFEVAINPDWSELAEVWETELDGVPVWLVGNDKFFTQAKKSEHVYTPGIEQYLFFSRAVLQVPEHLGWMPDVVHANDWHTGFVPLMMRHSGAKWEDVASVFTIHNLAYQGEFDVDVLDKAGLPRELFNWEGVEAWGRVNFLKSGAVYSHQLNTVSPRYAEEIQTSEYGCALEGTMRHLSSLGRLTGILNGIDREVFNPESDPHLAHPYSAKDLSGKHENKRALTEELGLPFDESVPLLGVVSRLSSQKGIDRLIDAAPALFELPVQLVVQGLGDPHLAQRLEALQAKYPQNMRFVQEFNEGLAQRVYAGCDMFLMPSLFEPCGLGQMIAMRYGTVPVVRATGGLADTVHEGENGFVFSEPNVTQLIAAVVRACKRFDSPVEWQEMVATAMACDFGWSRSALEYQKLYERARAAARPLASASA